MSRQFAQLCTTFIQQCPSIVCAPFCTSISCRAVLHCTRRMTGASWAPTVVGCILTLTFTVAQWQCVSCLSHDWHAHMLLLLLQRFRTGCIRHGPFLVSVSSLDEAVALPLSTSSTSIETGRRVVAGASSTVPSRLWKLIQSCLLAVVFYSSCCCYLTHIVKERVREQTRSPGWRCCWPTSIADVLFHSLIVCV